MNDRLQKALIRLDKELNFELLLQQAKKDLAKSEQNDAIAGFGWGCSDKTWNLSLKINDYQTILDYIKKST